MFSKVLVANRGEIAARIIRACQEMHIRTVAVYSTADAGSLHVRLADESLCIGPPANKDSYLHAPNIIAAAQITGAEAIHPGYGYLSERASFAEACAACRITFIGPSPAVIEDMGDKARARAVARAADVPTIPGSDGPITNDQQALATAQQVGFPVYIKAVAGGGGTGIRRVDDPDEYPRAVQMARSEAEAAFGSPEVYVEKLIEQPRHIEAQILGDAYGNVVHLGLRDCSVQSPRHKKLVEESPPPGLPAGLLSRIAEAAVRLCRHVGYRNAGTVEFILDRQHEFYFLEMNTRLQVEHPITEMVTGQDIVQLQLRIASGERLPFSQSDVTMNGHSIECRITAEDADRNFAPSAGTIKHVHFPGGLGVRVDSHIYSGYAMPPYYDPNLAKLIVHAPDRAQAVARMSRCLQEMVIDGITTNLPLQRRILACPAFRRGDVSTDLITKDLQPVTA
ncbi:MAG TPA: acetyl-CoA carboxylase biotin carboxylase subunit [Chthonomonadales bacterium]|nr:acetyl-CoA carboxylase biotin carboxylase subunit [Chthonomonadales bacterium]